MAKQVGIEFKREGPCVKQASLDAHTHQILRPKLSLKAEGVAEVRGGHLARPAGHRPWIGLPLGDGRQRWRAADGLGGRQRSGGGHLQIEILGAPVEIEHPIDVLHFADALQQAVAQAAGLEQLLPPLKTHTACGKQGTGVGINFDPIRLETPPRELGGDVASADVPLQLCIVFLLIAGEFQLNRQRGGWARPRKLGHSLPL